MGSSHSQHALAASQANAVGQSLVVQRLGPAHPNSAPRALSPHAASSKVVRGSARAMPISPESPSQGENHDCRPKIQSGPLGALSGFARKPCVSDADKLHGRTPLDRARRTQVRKARDCAPVSNHVATLDLIATCEDDTDAQPPLARLWEPHQWHAGAEAKLVLFPCCFPGTKPAKLSGRPGHWRKLRQDS
jgi:hypothetical protein